MMSGASDTSGHPLRDDRLPPARRPGRRGAITALAMVVAAGLAGGWRYAAADTGGPGSSAIAPSPIDDDDLDRSTSGESGSMASIDDGTGTDDGGIGEAAFGASDEVADATRLDCEAKEAELVRREENDLIDWEAIEASEQRIEIDDDNEETIELTLPPVDGSVAAPGERPALERFGPSFDLSTADDLDLVLAVEACEEGGHLGDEGFEDEVDEDEVDEDDDGES